MNIIINLLNIPPLPNLFSAYITHSQIKVNYESNNKRSRINKGTEHVV